MKKLIFSLGICSLLFAACSSSNNNPTPAGNSTLTNGKWKITASISDIDYSSLGLGTQTYDLYGSFSACQQDNLYIFNTDGTTTTDEGATKCNSSDPQQTASGTWQLLNNNTQMKIVGTNGSASVDVTADVLKLNSDSLVVHYTTNYGSGYPASTTTRYVHVP